MHIITEDNRSNWWCNVRIAGGLHLEVPDELGEELLLRGLARKAPPLDVPKKGKK